MRLDLDFFNYMFSIVGRVLIAWFNDCVFGLSGQITNLMIAMVNPVPYNSVHTRSLCDSFDASSRKTRNSQSLESRNQNPTYGIRDLCGAYDYHVSLHAAAKNWNVFVYGLVREGR